MPRSILRPQTGQLVWYFSAATAVNPAAAIIASMVDRFHANLTVIDRVTGATSFVASVVFGEGSRAPWTVTGATVAAGGTGYAANDVINLANGVQIKVATVTAGAVTTLTVQNGGRVQAQDATPGNPQAQISTAVGTGTGAAFNLTWAQGAWCTNQRINEFVTGTTPTSFANEGGEEERTALIEQVRAEEANAERAAAEHKENGNGNPHAGTKRGKGKESHAHA